MGMAQVLTWRQGNEVLRIEPWGESAVRVRAGMHEIKETAGSALLPAQATEARVEKMAGGTRLVVGLLTVELGEDGRVRFLRSDTGAVLLEEVPVEILHPAARGMKRAQVSSEMVRVEARFLAYEAERIYGLGQHRHGRLDQKGCVLDLAQRNCEVNIPFALSSRGYGFLWNNPAIGRVEFGHTCTRWVAEATPQLDYWICAGKNWEDLTARYAEATGHVPMLPEWASGFWQSKLRYTTQDELMAVAREYKRRELPLSVIVCDFFHWPMMGDMKFDSTAWPAPRAMVEELKGMGVELMVSVWPALNGNSENFKIFEKNGWLLQTARGTPALFPFFDTRPEGLVYLHYYDPTNAEARAGFWNLAKENYHALGIGIFWLDACEPEMNPLDYDNLVFSSGPGLAVANSYPLEHARAFYEGMQAAGQQDVLSLCRSAFAGSQRYGAAVWSGDIKSTFEVLAAQVPAGLNMGLSGIAWWTTDIGGFHSGNLEDEGFRELVVRWFQYGVFCPLFRLHGHRQPATVKSGADNEVWSFGEKAYGIIREQLLLRERLRPYVMAQMAKAHERGTPPMRPLFFDFESDTACHGVADQFMFGPDVMVAPVLKAGARERTVYLPRGADWLDAWTGKTHAGGETVTATAPLERIPVYVRASAKGVAKAIRGTT